MGVPMLWKLLFLLVALNLCRVSFAKYVAVLETAADSAAKESVSLGERQYLTNILREKAVQVLPAELNFTIMTRENINVNDNGDRSRAFSLSLDYNSDYVGLVTANKSDAALSVRCIKD